MKRKKEPDHNSNNGDRILVNKFIYDFADPRRWDVIVFKNPNNGKQNYIKRLVGLPEENLLIDNGDIYTMEPDGQGGWTDKTIVRKPPEKLKAMMQLVDDSDFIARELLDVDWPSRWNQWSGKTTGDGWEVTTSGGQYRFYLKSSDRVNWLRYRHLHPWASDWQTISAGNLPNHIKQNQTGGLISDYYCYNDQEYKSTPGYPRNPGAHWVGDLAMEATIDVKSDSGRLMFDLVEGGAHFICSIDVASGIAQLSCDDPAVIFCDDQGTQIESPSAATSIKGAGDYRVLIANADDKIFLWVNNRYIEFDGSAFKRNGKVVPKWSETRADDAEPLGIGGENIALTVNRLKVFRDVYYTSTTSQDLIRNEAATKFNLSSIRRIHENPKLWNSPQARDLFSFAKGKQQPMFPLKKNQFLPMGDNSPASLDGRVWDGPRFVDRSMLIGRAMFIYWPHSLNRPVKYFPNFGKMGFIR